MGSLTAITLAYALATVQATRARNGSSASQPGPRPERKVSYEQYFRTGGRHGGAGGSCAAADCPASGWQRCYAPTARPPPGRYSPVKRTEGGRETAAQKRDSSSARSDGCASSAAACCA